MNLTPTEIFLYGGSLTSLGWLLGHRLALKRDTIARQAIIDKEADIRRRAFLKFAHFFRGRMERVDYKDDIAVWREYVCLAPQFKGEVALVGGDFVDRVTFAKLADTIGGWPHEDVRSRAQKEKTNMRQIICDSIDRIIEFSEKDAQPGATAQRSWLSRIVLRTLRASHDRG